jgi:hypothetical protein
MTTATQRAAIEARRIPRRDADRATALLRACLQPPGRLRAADVEALAAAADPDGVLALARYHGVTGMLYDGLRRAGAAPPAILEPVVAAYEASVHRHLRSSWDLARVGHALDAASVSWVVVKGPAAVELLYGGAGGRSYADLDLLVDPRRFGPAIEALEAAGLRMLDRNWAVVRRELRGEVHLFGADGPEVDLHWNLVNMYRGRMRIPTAELLERAVPVTLAGASVRTPDPTDSLLHLCLHAALSGADRMVWIKDVERATACRQPDWDALVDRAARWRVAAPVGLVLARSAACLGAEVPATALRRLLGRGLPVLAGAVDRLFPWTRALNGVASPNRLLVRSAGQGLLRGTAWLAIRSVRNLDPDQERAESAFEPGGDDRDRAAFVADVMAGAGESPR